MRDDKKCSRLKLNRDRDFRVSLVSARRGMQIDGTDLAVPQPTSMASRTGVSVSQFAEQFYRSWTNPRGVTQVGESKSLSLESVKLPWKIGMLALHLD